MNWTIQNLILLIVIVVACLCLLAIVLAPFFHVTMPGEVQTYVFGLITLFLGGGATVVTWRAGEVRGEIKAANTMTIAQAVEITKRAHQ